MKLIKLVLNRILLTFLGIIIMSSASASAKNEIIMYHKPTCPFCKMALHLLEKKGFKEKDIEMIDVSVDDKARAEMLKKYGRTVPQIIINGVHVGGCDDLMDRIDDGKFQELLK